MRMTEASLYPVIPYLHVQQHDWEVTSMSDYAHTGRRSKTLAEHRTIEYRLMFGACYLLSLAGAIVARLTPWRKAIRSAARSAIDFQGSQQRCRGLGGLVVHGFVDGISSGLWPGG